MNETEIKELETQEMKDAEKAFWEEEANTDEFLKMQTVIDNKIEAIKLVSYEGMKLTAFKDKENTKRPNFRVEVILGANKGAKYVVSFSNVSAKQLCKSIGNQDFKAWEGKILVVAIAQKGQFKGIDYSLYKALVV